MARKPGNQRGSQANPSARRGGSARRQTGSARRQGGAARQPSGKRKVSAQPSNQKRRATKTVHQSPSTTGRRQYTSAQSRQVKVSQAQSRQPIPPSVYWKRRLIALLILLAVIGLIIWGIKSVIGYVNAVKAEQAEAARIQAYKERIIEPIPCDVSKLDVGVATKDAELAAGKDTTFTVNLHNPSKEQPCTMDAGAATLGVVIKTGDVTVYDSIKCAGEAERVPILLGPERSYSRPLTWSAKNYDNNCKVGDDLKPGTYRVSFKIDDSIDKNEIPFIIK